jgi:fibronectin type 3 domain-containing protein
LNGTSVKPGQTILYQGSATDPDQGALPPSALSWTVLLHHNSHIHTFVGSIGSSGSFVADNHGPIGTFSYEVILTAIDSSGLTGTASVTLPVVSDIVPPTTPSGLTAAAMSFSQINLSWTGSTDDVALTGYRVEQCQGNGCSNFTESATVSGTTLGSTGLLADTSYSFRVRAVDASGNLSGYSNVATARTLTPPPALPGLVAAHSFNEGSGTTSADISGNGNTGTLNGPVWTTQGKYGNALSFDGSNDLVFIPGSSSLNVSSGMTLEAWIYPTVTQSGWRTILQREVDAYFLNASTDAGPLRPGGGGTFNGAVSSLSGPTASPVNAWTHVALTYDGSILRLYVNGTQVATRSISGSVQTNSSPLRIGGNSPYGEYFNGRIDEVRVYNRALTQTEIQSDMNTPIGPADITPPTTPSGLTATAASSSRINLSWTASTDNIVVSGYRVERCQGLGCSNFAQIGTPSGTSYSDTGLGASTSYSYRVRAADSANNLSGYSDIASTVTLADTTPPTAPASLTANAVSGSQINLSWTASTDDIGVAAYRVERCQGAGCNNFAQIATPSGTTYGDTGLTTNTSYSYRVRAVDAASNLSSYSNTASATTQAGVDTVPPTAPAGLSATASIGQINLTWTASTDNIGVTGYRVERCQGAGCSNFAQIATSSTVNYSDTGLAANTSYSYRVRAADAATNLSNYSNVASATTPTQPVITGLVAAYAFNEGTGSTVADSSGNGNTGTINGATWTTQGKYGSALSFNGTSNLVVINGSASLNVSTAMTLEAWIYPTSNQTGWRTILQREVDAYFLNASFGGGNRRPAGGGTFNGVTSYVGGPGVNPTNAWTHVALTYDGSTLRLYVNSAQVATQTVSGTVEMNSSPLRIGGNSPYGEYFAGRIDEVRIYNRALSQAEIQTDMNSVIQ